MRKALNDNPVVQVVMLGILGIVVAFLLMTRVLGGPDEAAEPAAPAAPTSAVPAAPETVEPLAGTTGAFEAGAGLPASVVDAHENGDAVVLLVMQKEGIEDRELEREVASLESRGDTAVFVTDAKEVADYSRIAQGVNLDRTPAIIVIHPSESKKAKTGALPTATIAYGFRGPDSVEQAVRDALYKGKQLPFHPG